MVTSDAERDRIRAEEREKTEVEARLASLEKDMKKMAETQAWGFRVIWGAVVYMASQIAQPIMDALRSGWPK